MNKNILMLMMGGTGSRLGADCPKQFIEIDGIPIFAYILESYGRMPEIHHLMPIVHPEWREYTEYWVERLALKDCTTIVEGGEDRSFSVRNGMRRLEKMSEAEDLVLIHDATHPYVDLEGVRRVIDGVRRTGAATLVQGEYDTVYRRKENGILEEVIPRRGVVSGASPEAFRVGDIAKIYGDATEAELSTMTSAGAIALHFGMKMEVVEGNFLNLKITYPRDLHLLEHLIHTYFFPGAKERIQNSGNQ